MNEDMPWVNLTQEEVEELRNKKHELTEYGKQKLKEMLTHEEMLEEAERRERSNRILQRYNQFYNTECSGLPHGTPITPEHQQIIAMESMIDAIRCEYLNREYNEIAIADIEDLIERLREQADEFLKRVKKNNEEFWKFK
jgi:DNA repair exonuclease SbcCD ATPase subunit